MTESRVNVKSVVAMATALVVAWSPMSTASAQSRTRWPLATQAQVVEQVENLMPASASPEFRRVWEGMTRARNRIAHFAPPAKKSGNVGNLLEDAREMRKIAYGLAKGPDPVLAKRAGRLVTWLDIATAASKEERHERIRRLPVAIVESSTTDGGIQKDFVVRGRVVRRVYSGAMRNDHAAGPSALLTCYNEQPEPCLTQEEQDDLIIFIAAAEDEVAMIQSELDAEWAEYEAYCNTWGCEDGNDPAQVSSGPSESPFDSSWGCASHAAIATVGGAVAAFEIIDGAMGVGGAVAHSALIATAEAAAIAGGITAGVLLFAYGMYNFVQCKRAKVRAPDDAAAIVGLEPFSNRTKLWSLAVQ